MTDDATVAVESGIMVVTINRPNQRNAMTVEIAETIAEALTFLDASPDLTVAVLTGAGGTFCAGMDLKQFASGLRPVARERGFGGVAERPPKKPLIAAVEGSALGGGFEMVLACDLVVASETAKFGLPEVTRGLVARGGGLLRLPRRVPRAIALEMLMTGAPISANRAAELGLVNHTTAEGGALSRGLELAHVISANAPLAVRASKRVVDESAQWSMSSAFELQRSFTDAVFASEDAEEGIRAFVARRTPRWTGH